MKLAAESGRKLAAHSFQAESCLRMLTRSLSCPPATRCMPNAHRECTASGMNRSGVYTF